MESLQAVCTLVILQIFIRGLWSGGNVSGLFNHVLTKKYLSSVENDAFFLKEIVSKHLKHCLWYDIQYPKEDKGYKLIQREGRHGKEFAFHKKDVNVGRKSKTDARYLCLALTFAIAHQFIN